MLCASLPTLRLQLHLALLLLMHLQSTASSADFLRKFPQSVIFLLCPPPPVTTVLSTLAVNPEVGCWGCVVYSCV